MYKYASVGAYGNAMISRQVICISVHLKNDRTRYSQNYIEILPHTIIWLLLVPLFFNCTQMHVITYANTPVLSSLHVPLTPNLEGTNLYALNLQL